MNTDAIAITNSDRATFRECERKHYFSSHLRSNLQPVEEPPYLEFGTAIHKALEAHYKGENGPEFFAELMRSSSLSWEFKELGIQMLCNYVTHWKDKFEVIATEYTFEVPVPFVSYANIQSPHLYGAGDQLVFQGRPVVYKGTVDLLYRSKNGSYFIMDHKTCAQFNSMDYLKLDEQITSYIWAMQKDMNITIVGGVINELKKIIPSPVQRLKNGTLSTSYRNLVTLHDYKEAIEQYELDPKDYKEYLDFLKTRPSPFFRRTKTRRNKVQLSNFEDRLFVEAVRILESPTSPYGLPSPSSRNCNYCAFRLPCVAVEDGSDVDALKRLLFRERTYDTVG